MFQSAARLAGLSVLILEDDSIVSMLMEDILTESGCAVIGPAAGQDDAAALIGDRIPDAALLDITLRHGGDSYATAAQLAAHDVPFAFVTGLRCDHIDPEWRGVPVLAKPFSRSSLIAIVRRLAQTRHAH